LRRANRGDKGSSPALYAASPSPPSYASTWQVTNVSPIRDATAKTMEISAAAD